MSSRDRPRLLRIILGFRALAKPGEAMAFHRAAFSESHHDDAAMTV